VFLLPLSSCGVSQSEYDKVLAENEQLKYDLQISIEAYDSLYEIAFTMPAYFENKNALEDWLDSYEDLPLVNATFPTFYDWYLDGLFCQSMALIHGYIISVSYTTQDTGLAVWCEAVTQDGHVYCFDPNKPGELFDSGFNIDPSLLE
jgi:hypothetical protein